MQELQQYKDELAQAVAKYLGDDSRQPREFGGQIRLVGQEAAILALPDVPTAAMDMIVTDPASPYFGRRRFLAGVSRFDSNDVLI